MSEQRTLIPTLAHVRVRDCMHTGVFTCAPDDPLRHVAAVMANHKVHADDRAAVRRSLRRLLDGAQHVNVIAEASDLATATREVQARLPRVLILDLGLPNGSSIETLDRLRAQVPRTEVVVLTMDESP